MTEIDPIIQTVGVGGGLLAAAWAIYSKLRANTAGDTASATRSEAEASLYDKLRAELDRAESKEAERAVQISGMESEIRTLRTECEADRKEAFARLDEMHTKLAALQNAVAACEARHQHREAQDELGRTGQIERRQARRRTK